jgi:catechol 2,3-dioxygenase-like lactoylglutathione lyase family enzyme
MMAHVINGAHVVIYSRDAEADRAFIRDVLGFGHVDAGDGWLIFKLPPAEAAVHPAGERGAHELYLMCDDIETTTAELAEKGAEFEPVRDAGWGRLSAVKLPGGGELGLYQPRHLVAYDLDG